MKYIVAWNYSGDRRHRVMPLRPVAHYTKPEAERKARLASGDDPDATYFVFDEDVEVVATYRDGKRVMRSLTGRAKRDISRADLKHLSGAALLKLLRQAMKAGDEEKAEMIGKELDRRGEGFRRTGRDAERDSPKKVRTLVALLPVHAGSYHVIAYTRSSSAGHISTKKLGSYRSKAKGKAHLNRARTAMRGKKGRGTSIGFVDATTMKLLPFSRMLQRRLAPYRKARA